MENEKTLTVVLKSAIFLILLSFFFLVFKCDTVRQRAHQKSVRIIDGLVVFNIPFVDAKVLCVDP